MKKGIGYSSLSDKVYLGKQNKTNGTWVGEKEDITSDFIGVSLMYYEENTVRDIGGSDGSSNLMINIKNDKESIEKFIKHLTKLIEDKDTP